MLPTVQKTVKKICHGCNGRGSRKVPSRRGLTVIQCPTCKGTRYINKSV